MSKMGIQLITKMKIGRPAHEVFEAFVDPSKIGNFWFSSSSGRWEQGKSISLRYDEYNAQVEIKITEIEVDARIVFQWGALGEERTNTIEVKESGDGSTIIEVNEKGWNEHDEHLQTKLIDNKEGWVYMLTCLKGYLENNISSLRTGLVK